MKVDVYHHIRWPRYKARIFSALHEIAVDEGEDVRFLQIADTDSDRMSLGGVDLSYHRYPHEVLFPGAYGAIPRTRLIRTLFRHVYTSDADVVAIAGYDRPEFWAMLAAAVLSRKRRAVFCDSTLRDRAQSRLKGVMKRFFFGACDAFLAYGSRSRELLVHYGADARAVYQPCQAAALPDTYDEAAAFAARVRNARKGPPEVCFVGRLSPEKSLGTLFAAFAEFAQTHPGARLTMVGSGPQRSELEALAVDLGIEPAVEFTGPLQDDGLAAAYSRASVLVLPSVSEAWGLVVNEALHHGCPVVVSDRCGCVPELVVEGETGFTFAAGDPHDLAAKLSAAVDAFGDVDEVARRCQAQVAPFTPERAASNILAGCRYAFNARDSARLHR